MVPAVQPELQDSERYPLKRPPLWSFGFVLQLGIIVLWSGTLLQSPSSPSATQQSLLSGLVFIAVLITLSLRRIHIYRSPLAPVQTSPTKLWLPNGSRAHGTSTVDYLDLLGISLGGQKPFRRLVIESAQRAFVYDERDFQHSKDLDRLHKELISNIRLHPKSAAIRNKLEAHRHRIQSALSVTPLTTQGLLGWIGLGYLITRATGIQSPLDLVRWGAMMPSLIWQKGEVYRLFSAFLLQWDPQQTDFAQLALLTLALMVFGSVIERLIGSARLLCIVTLSMLSASLTALGLGVDLFFGGLSLVFALGGAHIVLQTHPSFPAAFKQSTSSTWLIVLWVAALIMIPSDHWGPALGATLSGAAVTWLLTRTHRPFPMRPWGRESFRWTLTIAIATVLLASMLTGLWRGKDVNTAREKEWLLHLSQVQTRQGDISNAIAYTIALHPDVERAHLHNSQKNLEPFLERNPEALSWIDTMAALWHRLGDGQQAVRLQRQALEGTTHTASDWLSAETLKPLQQFYALRLTQLLLEHPISETKPFSIEKQKSILRLTSPQALSPSPDTSQTTARPSVVYIVGHKAGRPHLLIQLNTTASQSVDIPIPFELTLSDDVQWQSYAFKRPPTHTAQSSTDEASAQPWHLWHFGGERTEPLPESIDTDA